MEIELFSAISFFHIQSSWEEKQETDLCETASLLLFFCSRSVYVKSEILTGLGRCGWINAEETLLVILLCIKTSSVPKDLRVWLKTSVRHDFAQGHRGTCVLFEVLGPDVLSLALQVSSHLPCVKAARQTNEPERQLHKTKERVREGKKEGTEERKKERKAGRVRPMGLPHSQSWL